VIVDRVAGRGGGGVRRDQAGEGVRAAGAVGTFLIVRSEDELMFAIRAGTFGAWRRW